MYEVPSYQVDPARLPPVLHTSEPGSFAQNTVAVRIPKIIEGTVAANQFEPDVRSAVMELRDEILHGRIRTLREDAPDRRFWDAVGADYFGRSWLDVPWYWAETYFYRRMLEATRYFQPGPGRLVDPFAPIKHAEWQPDHAPRFAAELLAGAPGAGDGPQERFGYLLRGSLWSNRIDLSYRTVRADAAQNGDYLLVDHTAAVWEYLSGRRGGRIVMLADNAGTELLADLALVDLLLGHDVGLAGQVIYHVKGQPFFVSDTLAADVDNALVALGFGGPQTAALAARLRGYRAEGRLELVTHWAYVTSLFYFQSPPDLRAMWGAAGLVILKGDANYRRLIGDLHWPAVEPFESVTAYFPAPLLAVRTLKSDPVVGLKPGLAERLDRDDPQWRVNGVRGVIQANLHPARPAPA